MGTFYDPKKKTVKGWVFVSFILIPIILVVALIIYGKQLGGKP